jgi:hypothetical protein
MTFLTKKGLLVLVVAGLIATGCTKLRSGRITVDFVPAISDTTDGKHLWVIPSGDDNRVPFYVVVSNGTGESIPLAQFFDSSFDTDLSLEATLPDGRKSLMAHEMHDISESEARQYIIGPGEYFVFPVRLDKSWPNRPPSMEGVKLKAIYEFGGWPHRQRIESPTHIVRF